VIDLGSGAGFDVFLASTKIGASGRAIGVDMDKVDVIKLTYWSPANTQFLGYACTSS
jgi:hypothetical protein